MQSVLLSLKRGRNLACAFALVFLLINSSLLLADEWDETYNRGTEAMKSGSWDQAIAHFQRALELKPRPDAYATTSSLKPVEYLPYYYLGQAFLFRGQYQLALNSFLKSQEAGQVNKTSEKRRLPRFIEVTQQLLEREEVLKELEIARRGQQGLESEAEVRINSVADLINQGRYVEAKVANAELQQSSNSAVARAFATLLDDVDQARVKPVDPKAQARQHFDEGMRHFVSGLYGQALDEFQKALRWDSDFSLASSMIVKTRSELRALKPEPEPPPTVPAEDTVLIPAGPEFEFGLPEQTSSQILPFRGMVDDRRGLEMLSFTLNGQPLLDELGNEIFLTPGPSDAPQNFSFSVDIPLKLGENQIHILARFQGSDQPELIQEWSVTRIPPWYLSSRARILGVGLLLIVLGFVLVGKYWKYRIGIINKYNPYIAGAPIRNEEMFFGREKLIKRILNTLHNNSMMVYGPRRIGKTSLQHQLKHRLETLNDPEYDFIPVFIDLQGTSQERFFQALMEEILDTCKDRLNGRLPLRFNDKGSEYGGRDFSRDLKKVLDNLSQQTKKKLKLVLLMDEVDELNKYSEQVNQKLRSVFMKTFAESLVAVMSGAHLNKTWESEGSPWYNFFEEIEVPPFEREDAVTLINQPVTGIFTYEQAAVDKIIEYSECKPYIIQKFCVNVINRIIEQKRRRVTVADVETVKPIVLRKTEETQTVPVA